VLRRHGFEDDAGAEGLELSDGPLTLTIGVVPDDTVATQVLVAALLRSVGSRMLKPRSSLGQIAKARSSNATASRRLAGSSTASS
jgi:hypothetical protein